MIHISTNVEQCAMLNVAIENGPRHVQRWEIYLLNELEPASPPFNNIKHGSSSV